jgi:hypothetical protein
MAENNEAEILRIDGLNEKCGKEAEWMPISAAICHYHSKQIDLMAAFTIGYHEQCIVHDPIPSFSLLLPQNNAL